MKKIKVAVDDSALIKQLHSVLNPMGYTLEMLEMNQHIADSDFSETHLIVLDPHLGDTGIVFGLVDTLKSRSATSQIPILLCTHQENDDSIVDALSAGANDFILLPIPSHVLLLRVKSLLNK